MSYEHLHYSADVTDSVLPDSMLGFNEEGRPFKVVSADYDGERTTVVLTLAGPDDLRRWQAVQ